MMKLNLMKRFFDSVDEEWRSPIANEIGQKWFSGNFDAICIRASANFAFLVKAGEQKYVLRFNHASEREEVSINAELDYIEHLAAKGIRVNTPIRSLAGNLLESVDTPFGMLHSVLFDFLPGSQLELDSMSDEAFRQWGQTLGQMHNASQGFISEGRMDWSTQLERVRQIIPESEATVWEEVGAITNPLQELPVNTSNYGMVHFDFEPDNLVWSEGKIGIYDLDDCMYGWFAMDISNALSSELFNDRITDFDLANYQFQRFLEGYRFTRAIGEDELKHLPAFLRLDNLIAFARIYRSIAENPEEDEPKWTADLRHKLQMKLANYRDDFKNHPIRAIYG